MSSKMRLAFFGDIHGNLPALEAVLADLEKLAPDAVYLLGDLVNRCPWSAEVLDLLVDRRWPGVQGNHDLVLAWLNTPHSPPPFDDRRRFPVIYWTWERLRAQDLALLRSLPADLSIHPPQAPAIRLFHGLPGDPFRGVFPGMEQEQAATAFSPYPEPVIICGHTHRPLDCQFGPRRIFNPGSVGMPYNGDPRAQYLVLDLVSGPAGPEWRPDFRRIVYDRERVKQGFEGRGLLQAGGPVAGLFLRTVLDGQPWASDFGQWLRDQPPPVRKNPSAAVDDYLQAHGPDQWAFRG